MNVTGDFEVDLECVPVSSDSNDMGPLVAHRKNKSLEI